MNASALRLPKSWSPLVAHLTRGLMRLLMLWLALAPLSALADPAALSRNRGLWHFTENYEPFWPVHPALEEVGFTAQSSVSTTQPYWRIQNIGNIITPRNVRLLEFPLGLTDTQYVRMRHNTGPNGPPGADYTNSWTVVMDVRFPAVGNWIGLLQDAAVSADGTGSQDGEIFVNPNGALDFVGAGVASADGAIAANTWYRLGFRSFYNVSTGLQELQAFINGSPSGGVVTSAPDGRYGLAQTVAFFTDNDNETQPLGVNSLAFWGEALSNQDLADIGAFASNGISWPGQTSQPPVPPLSGNLYFGSFLTTFTPANVPVNEINEATRQGAVAGMGLDFLTDQGKIPFMPSHTFGGRLQVDVMPNGDCYARASKPVRFLPPGGTVNSPDLDAAANVIFQRAPVTLSPVNGASTTQLAVNLPAGFSVAVQQGSRRNRSIASINNVVLKARLIPATTLNLDKKAFAVNPAATGDIYPNVDRVPVTWTTPSIAWNAETGKFTYTATAPLVHHREPEFNALGQVATGVNSSRLSNDLYYLWAKTALMNVVISSRSDFIAAVDQMQFTLDPDKFPSLASGAMFAHYPMGMGLGWNTLAGSVFTILNDQISSSSRLAGPTAGVQIFRQGSLAPSCDGPDDNPGSDPLTTIGLTPSTAGWLITPDGGLRADVTTNANTINFGAWQSGATTLFAHSLTKSSPQTGRALVAGTAVKGTEVAHLTGGQRVAGLLFSGHSSPATVTRLERPGTAAYLEGLADYPGVNLRSSTGGPTAGISRLAGSLTAPYALRPTSKYYINGSGVSGRHDSADGAGTTFVSGNQTYTVSALRLAFLDNKNTASGVAGGVAIPFPANFNLNFSGLRFGPRGDLESATLTGGQPDKTLAYWNTVFTPLAIGFSQPKTCPPANPEVNVLNITMRTNFPTMATTGAVGTIGFYEGDIVTAAQPVVDGILLSKGAPPTQSRFAVPGTVQIPGPQGETWPLQPTGGLYLNRWAERDTSSGSPDASQGSVNLAGLLDVPFFVDTPVLASASSSSTASPTASPLAIRKQWSEVFVDPSTLPVFDPNHRGRPFGILLGTYRATNNIPSPDFATHDVALRKKWLDLIDLDFAVRQNATRRFSSVEIDSSSLLIFNLRRQVTRLTPGIAEIQFDGQATTNLMPQLNVGSLLADTGILTGITLPIGNALNNLTALEDMTGDTLEPLLRPGLTSAATSRAAALHQALKTNVSTAAAVSSLTSDINSLLNSSSSGLAGTWRRDMASRATQGRAAVTQLLTIANSAGNLLSLANAMRNTVAPGSAAAGALPPSVESARVSLVQLLTELDSQFAALESALGAGASPTDTLTNALRSTLGNTAAISAVVDQTIADLNAKWGSRAGDVDFYNQHPPAELAADWTAALTNRWLASAFSGSAGTLIRQYAGDPAALLRQATDDLVRQAQQTITKVLDDNVGAAAESLGLGALSSVLGSARLQGYARINGDTLQDLRLDGQVRLKLPDADNSLNFDGNFLIRSLDSSTPDVSGAVAAGVKTEVSASAATSMKWGLRESSLSLGGKVALDGGGSVIGMTGDIALGGEFDFEAIKLTELKFGFGAGAGNGYVYGRAAGSLELMSVAAGIFIGQTTDVTVLKHADPDIGGLLAHPSMGLTGSPTLTGAIAYAEGSMSLMPLIGIPPSCVLDLRIGGGQGYFGFLKTNGLVAGVKQNMNIGGELLCLVDVGGSLNFVMAGNATMSGGRLTGFSLDGSATATVRGEVGISPFSYDFEKSLLLRIHASPFDWSLDY